MFQDYQVRHDTAVCEMILTCQLLVGNWSDLHANGRRLLSDVGGCGVIKWGNVHWVFCALPLSFPAFAEWNEHVDFILIQYTVYFKWQQWSHLFSINKLHPCEWNASLWTSHSRSIVTHAFTCLLYAWVELVTYATCANCSSIMSGTQQHLAGE